MTNAYWNYFISLERDFIKTLDFVALEPANQTTYGDNFAKLILAVGSEVDVLAKALCKSVSPQSPAENILHYQGVLTGAYPELHTVEIAVVRNGDRVLPWNSWDPNGANQSPAWWRAYNSIKHDRVVNFPNANQRNALEALSGLLVINLYYYKGTPEPYPQLLDGGTPQNLIVSSSAKLPGL